MSDLGELFAFQLRAAGIDGFVREFKFDPARKWRADFAFVAERLLVECDGGTWQPNTGHNSGAGKNRDCERDAEAVIAGWRVLRVTSNMVRDGRAMGYLERLLGVRTKPAEGSFDSGHSVIPLAENATK